MNKKQLYESIMKSISKEVKKALHENTISDEYDKPIFVKENYHSHYDDDDAEIYYYNPVTREFSVEEWTTRFACGAYPKTKDVVTIAELINKGIVDKDQFIDDLIAKYGVRGCGEGLLIGGYPTTYAYGKNCGFPIILNGRKYKGNAVLIAMHKGFISRYGRVESNKYEVITEDGKYLGNISTSFNYDYEKYKEIITKKLHEVPVEKAINYVLPWNEASLWELWPIIPTENLRELRIEKEHEKELDRLSREEEKLVAKTNDLYNWANEKFPEESEDFKIEKVKRCLSKYYDVHDEAFMEKLINSLERK